MVSVQVERDPRTGAAVVRSVAPVSSPSGADRANVVFDDGRKSIHALGGSEGQPSTQELGQILNVIDGVGLTALLDDVAVVTTGEETKSDNVAVSGRTGETLPSSSHHRVTEDHVTRDAGSRAHGDSQPEVSREVTSAAGGAVDDVEDQKYEDGLVTLLFLGYTDATAQNIQEGGDEGMLTVERVMITDDGDEYVIGSRTSPPSTPTPDKETDGQEEPEEVLLEGNGADCKGQGEGHPLTLPPPSQAKKRTCQCCAVM